MRVKTFLFVLVAVAFIFGLTTGVPAAQAQSIVLKYANFPPAPTFPSVQMERWAQEVEKRTNGKVKVQTFPGSTLLGAKNMLDGVVSGIADIGCFCPSYQPGRFPVSEAVDLPMGFSNARVASLVYFDLIDKYKPKEFEKTKLITLFTCAPSNFMTKTPVKSLKDLKGMELRVAGTGSEVVKRAGGVPVAMPQSETPDAIQKGVVKGIVSSMEILKDFNFSAYTPFATIVNTHVVTFAVVMNQTKWNSLPEDVKKVIDDLRREQSLWTGNYMDNHVKEALDWSKQKHNLQLIELPASEKADLQKLLAPMIDDYIKKVTAQGLPGDQIIKDVNQLKDKYEKQYK